MHWRLTSLFAALLALASCTDATGPADAVNCPRDPDLPRLELVCSSEPLPIAGDPGFTTVAAGLAHTCGLTTAGEVFCWGDNSRGQLGSGTAVAVSVQPVKVTGELRFTALTVGASHSCALAAEGAAYCWGENTGGELGAGAAGDPSHWPVPVVGGISFAAISAGGSHTCGIDREGGAHCWGLDWYGELGHGVWDGTLRSVATPSAVVGELTFTRIAAGGRATCALTPEGRAYCWGFGHLGQLGTDAVAICLDLLPFLCSPAPVRVATTRRFVSLSSGRSHFCALAADGEALCWGDESQGKRGPAPGDRFTPAPIPTARFSAIAAGGDSTCGITTAGPTLCWGLNMYGQLGTGSREYSSETPSPVLGGHTFSVVTPGVRHTCALTTGGRTYCWGSNESAQLGTGTW